MKNKKTLEELVKEALETPPAIQIVKEIKGEEIFNRQNHTCGSYISIMAEDLDEYIKHQRKVIESYLCR